jgi:chromate transport protein ChrA
VDRLSRNANLILVGHAQFTTLGRRKAAITLTLLAGVTVLAVTGLLNPAISIPLAAVLAILLGRVKPAKRHKWRKTKRQGNVRNAVTLTCQGE